MNTNASHAVFVWRTSSLTTSQGPHCKHCDNYIPGVDPTFMSGPRQQYKEIFSTIANKYRDDPYWDEFVSTGKGGRFTWHPYELLCKRCGWWASGVTNFNGEKFERVIEAGLLEFDINDGELVIEEILSHVSKRHSDIFTLTPRKFEEIVADVYSGIGWDVEMTKQTRDGGVDLVCLKNSANETCIVDCKRYSKDRKVGIAAVDRLVGAAFRNRTKSAHLVTTSSFTGPAQKAGREASERGLELSLVDGCELLKLVDAFSDPSLTVTDIEQLYSDR